MNKKTVILLTINGWGVSSTENNNAIRKANINDFKYLVANYPSTVVSPVFDKLSDNYKSLGSGLKIFSDIYHNSVSKIIEENHLSQIKIADSENFPLLSVFFNNQEDRFNNEEWRLVNRKKNFLDLFFSFDNLISKKIINSIKSRKYDFIFANFNQIGAAALSGDFNKTILFLEKTSLYLKKISKVAINEDAVLIILGSFGAAEDMFNVNTGFSNLHKSKNPVPLLIISKDLQGKSIGLEEAPNNDLSLLSPQGDFSDIAPTILKIMNINIPSEMTGESFI